jgi:carboxylesterase
MTKKPLGVLVVHGFTSSLDCVRGVESAVSALGVPTRMPVLRGHGAESPDALRGVTWRDWVADAESALQDLLTEAEQAIVFGHSMGGLVALTLAADHGDVIDSAVVAAAAVQLTSPLAPGRPLHVLAPLVLRFLDKIDMPPVYADPSLAQHDTNYAWAPTDAVQSLMAFSQRTRRRLSEVEVPMLIMQSRNDSTVAPESAQIIYQGIATPPEEKRIIWFEKTEHEMFRDCEREAASAAVADWVRQRMGGEIPEAPQPSLGGDQ